MIWILASFFRGNVGIGQKNLAPPIWCGKVKYYVSLQKPKDRLNVMQGRDISLVPVGSELLTLHLLLPRNLTHVNI